MVASEHDALVASACSSDPSVAMEQAGADRTDLAGACVSGDAAYVASTLAGSGFDPQTGIPPFGWQPILYACFTRLGRVQPERVAGIRAVVRSLLDAGADPNASFDHEGWLQVPLYGSAGIQNDAELTAMLLAAGADPNDAGEREVGEALYHASEFADPACAALLIDAGTDAGVVRYCLGRALNFPNQAMVETFCARGVRPTAGHLHQAVLRRRPVSTVELLLDAGARVDHPDEHGRTPLRNAVRWGSDEVATLLLARGATASAVTDEDRALGAYLSGAGDPPPAGAGSTLGLDELLGCAVDGGDADAVGRLIEVGAAVEGESGAEHAPLGIAAWHGRVEVVQELLAQGAGSSAIGAALHGSRHCHHPEGGPTMQTVQEIPRDPYARIVRLLLDAGTPMPERLEGEPPVADLLAALGIGKINDT
jgi:ankyrin repeat protein